jgi:hypothetical protein
MIFWPGYFPRVRVGHHLQQPTGFDRDRDLLEGDVPLGHEPVILVRRPPERLHDRR